MSEILESAESAQSASEGSASETSSSEQSQAGWLTPDGGITDGAPEIVRNLVEAKKWDNVEQLAKGYSELEKLVGTGDYVVLPKDDNPEAWDKVYNTLGRPEEPDAYEIKYEGDLEIDPELSSRFKQYAHKLGLTQKQFNDIVSFQLDTVKLQAEAVQQRRQAEIEENINVLKREFGLNYESKIRDARAIADKLGIYNVIEQKGLASDPDIIKMLDVIASRSAEDSIAPTGETAVGKTPEQELEDIKAGDAFTKKFHPDHKKIMERFMELNHIIANRR